MAGGLAGGGGGGGGRRGALCLVLVLLFSSLCPSSFEIHLGGEKRAGCIALTVL